MSSHLEVLTENADALRKALEKLWAESKAFKYTALISGSITASLSLRYLYIKASRKYNELAPGTVGVPLLGHSHKVFDIDWLATVPVQYGDMASVQMFGSPGVLINDPVLAKKMHHDPRSYNVPKFGPESATSFGTMNGKAWSDRRKIISSNLMSTMKAEYVEIATRRFISSKVFTAFDRDIAAGKCTTFKPLLRPIGFNITLQACYGKELESLDDPLWTGWNSMLKEMGTRGMIQLTVAYLFGFSSTFSLKLQRMLTGSDFTQGIGKLVDYVETFESAKDVDAEKDEHVKLFSDFVDSYVQSDQGKYTKRQLQGDMITMFTAATDTTYSAISFALLAAAQQQKLQQELHEEAMSAFDGDLDRVKLKDGGIFKIPKLRAFIHEVLRLYPPAPVTGFREIMEDGVTLGGYNLPKGTMPLVNCAGINMNPKYWIKGYDVKQHGDVNMRDIHLEFWMENGAFVKKLQSDNFFVFHSGKRDCVGQALAMKELMVVLAMVFMKYRVSAADGDNLDKIEGGFKGTVVEPVLTQIRLEHRK